jgi:hypothetical protein
MSCPCSTTSMESAANCAKSRQATGGTPLPESFDAGSPAEPAHRASSRRGSNANSIRTPLGSRTTKWILGPAPEGSGANSTTTPARRGRCRPGARRSDASQAVRPCRVRQGARYRLPLPVPRRRQDRGGRCRLHLRACCIIKTAHTKTAIGSAHQNTLVQPVFTHDRYL